ncbi:MAG: hypothetical protein HYX32_12515, partial [Actinobacteria bacterium]|nr:hypothetical protein [Actinomycetota bacterium]
AARYGLPAGDVRWRSVNGYLYVSVDPADPETFPQLEEAARETLESRRWREEAQQWFGVARARVIEGNLALQAVDLDMLDDRRLARHVQHLVANFLSVAPLHFEHLSFELAVGELVRAGEVWGLTVDNVAGLVRGPVAGSPPVAPSLDRVAAALAVAGVREPADLDDVRNASGDARTTVDDYFSQFGWRVNRFDVDEPVLIERPDRIVSDIRALIEPTADTTAAERRERERLAMRDRVPQREREQFDELVAAARSARRLRDDGRGVCVDWPLGLIRKGLLEAGSRLLAAGRLDESPDVFEAAPMEVVDLLWGKRALRPRRNSRRAANCA